MKRSELRRYAGNPFPSEVHQEDRDAAAQEADGFRCGASLLSSIARSNGRATVVALCDLEY
jgi:hypothetical protein